MTEIERQLVMEHLNTLLDDNMASRITPSLRNGLMVTLGTMLEPLMVKEKVDDTASASE